MHEDKKTAFPPDNSFKMSGTKGTVSRLHTVRRRTLTGDRLCVMHTSIGLAPFTGEHLKGLELYNDR